MSHDTLTPQILIDLAAQFNNPELQAKNPLTLKPLAKKIRKVAREHGISSSVYRIGTRYYLDTEDKFFSQHFGSESITFFKTKIREHDFFVSDVFVDAREYVEFLIGICRKDIDPIYQDGKKKGQEKTKDRIEKEAEREAYKEFFSLIRGDKLASFDTDFFKNIYVDGVKKGISKVSLEKLLSHYHRDKADEYSFTFTQKELDKLSIATNDKLAIEAKKVDVEVKRKIYNDKKFSNRQQKAASGARNLSIAAVATAIETAVAKSFLNIHQFIGFVGFIFSSNFGLFIGDLNSTDKKVSGNGFANFLFGGKLLDGETRRWVPISVGARIAKAVLGLIFLFYAAAYFTLGLSSAFDAFGAFNLLNTLGGAGTYIAVGAAVLSATCIFALMMVGFVLDNFGERYKFLNKSEDELTTKISRAKKIRNGILAGLDTIFLAPARYLIGWETLVKYKKELDKTVSKKDKAIVLLGAFGATFFNIVRVAIKIAIGYALITAFMILFAKTGNALSSTVFPYFFGVNPLSFPGNTSFSFFNGLTMVNTNAVGVIGALEGVFLSRYAFVVVDAVLNFVAATVWNLVIKNIISENAQRLLLGNRAAPKWPFDTKGGLKVMASSLLGKVVALVNACIFGTLSKQTLGIGAAGFVPGYMGSVGANGKNLGGIVYSMFNYVHKGYRNFKLLGEEANEAEGSRRVVLQAARFLAPFRIIPNGVIALTNSFIQLATIPFRIVTLGKASGFFNKILIPKIPPLRSSKKSGNFESELKHELRVTAGDDNKLIATVVRPAAVAVDNSTEVPAVTPTAAAAGA